MLFCVPILRTRSEAAPTQGEMETLSGPRLWISLGLELSDVVWPLLRRLGSTLSSLIQFVLVSFIGRSLGLVYRGVRSAGDWTSNGSRSLNY